jgi:hypothetical protein
MFRAAFVCQRGCRRHLRARATGEMRLHIAVMLWSRRNASAVLFGAQLLGIIV